jgi:hypothetical protein
MSVSLPLLVCRKVPGLVALTFIKVRKIAYFLSFRENLLPDELRVAIQRKLS